MGRYLVGSDRSGGNDQGCIDTVCKVLQDGGKEAVNCGVTPNTESSFRSKGKKDDIGVFIVNGMCLGTILSCNDMVKSGICNQVIFGIPKPIMNSTFKEKESLTDENKKLKLVNDGTNWPSSYRKYEGKYTVDGLFNALDGVSYAYGETCEQVGQNILSGASGTDGTGGTGDSESSSEDDKKEPTPMSYMDMIKDLIKVWDGDVEVKIRQNRMYINKVHEPQPELWIVDGNNVTSGSAKVTDYNSDTVNTLNVTYNNGAKTITITDEYLVNRFGTVEAETKAEKIVTDYTGDSSGVSAGNETGEQETASLYSQISQILQDNYEKPAEGWNSLTNKVRLAKDGNEIGKLLSAQKKKQGKENKSYVDVRHEIQKLRGMGY